jgi:hypothetical protein
MTEIVKNHGIVSRFGEQSGNGTTYIPGTSGNQNLHKKDCPFLSTLGNLESITIGHWRMDIPQTPQDPKGGLHKPKELLQFLVLAGRLSIRRQFCQACYLWAHGTLQRDGYSDALEEKWGVGMSEVCATISPISSKSSDSWFRNHSVPPLEPFANSVGSIGTLLPIGGIFRNFCPAHTIVGGTLSSGSQAASSTSLPGATVLQSTRAGVNMHIYSRRLLNGLQCADSRMAIERLVDMAAFVDMPASFGSSRLNHYYAAPAAASEV